MPAQGINENSFSGSQAFICKLMDGTTYGNDQAKTCISASFHCELNEINLWTNENVTSKISEPYEVVYMTIHKYGFHMIISDLYKKQSYK